MKIALIRHSVRNRGSDRSLSYYAGYLTEHRHEVHYYTSSIKTELKHHPAIQFRKIKPTGVFGTIIFISSTKFKEDIVLVDLVIMAGFAWFLNRKKIIYTARDFDVSYYKSKIIRKLMSIASYLVLHVLAVPTISASTELSNRLMVFKPKNLKTVDNGVDLTLFYCNNSSKFMNDKKGKVVILLFVRDDYRKGLDIGIKALMELSLLNKEIPWELWTIGKELNGLDSISPKQFGFVKEEALRDILSAVDIYMVPSRSEGLSTLLLQALACQCAVVGTEAVNIIGHSKEGLISPLEDWKSLAENLNLLVRNQTLRETMKLNARRLAEQYSLEKSCSNFEKALLASMNMDK